MGNFSDEELKKWLTEEYNKEIDDLKKNVVDEKDFLEAVYAYLYILKNGHFNFVESIIHNSVNICDNQ